MTLEDILIAARTVYGESSDQPYQGQKAVAHCIFNRAAVEGAIAVACLRPKQFSCWNLGDPTRQRMLKADFDDIALRTALRAVMEALSEPDFTNGCRHYHTRAVTPSWAAGRTPDLVIGDHLFYRGIP